MIFTASASTVIISTSSRLLYLDAFTDIERIEIGQSVDDSQPLNEELTSNSNQVQPQPPENILNDNENFCGEPADHGKFLEVSII